MLLQRCYTLGSDPLGKGWVVLLLASSPSLFFSPSYYSVFSLLVLSAVDLMKCFYYPKTIMLDHNTCKQILCMIHMDMDTS